MMELQGQHSTLMGDRCRAKLESAVARPQATVFGEDAFRGLAEKAAALLQGITIAHAFTDGNKRAAAGAMLSFLELNGVPLVADEDALYDLVIAVTTGEMHEVADMPTVCVPCLRPAWTAEARHPTRGRRSPVR